MIRNSIILLLALLPLHAAANFQSDFLKNKKAKAGKGGGDGGSSGQWTLADWLSQKNKNSLMDQWLALHSHTEWFEMNVGANSQQFQFKTSNATSTTNTTQSAQQYQAHINVALFDFTGEYQKTNDSKESWGYAGGLRLLGTSQQTTNLIARYGWRRLTDLKTQEQWDNQFAEGALQLYIVQEFGVDGTYRYYLPSTSNQGNRLEGHKVTAGVFFEFSIFRIYTDYFQEPLQLSKNGVVTEQSDDGFEGGIKLYF